MNKQKFLSELRAALKGLPKDDVEGRVSFYSEMIDDRVEEGMTEEQAVASIAPISEIVAQTVSDASLTKIVKERIKGKRSYALWEILLIVFTFPLWFSLLVAVFAVFLSVFVVIWALVLTVWVIDLAFGAAFFGGLIFVCVYLINGYTLPALAALGISLFCAGAALIVFFAAIAAAKGAAKFSKAFLNAVKRLFIKKEVER